MLVHWTHEAPFDSVFVHGAGGNGLLWKRSLQSLTGAATAYAVNLPGHPTGVIECKSIGEYSDSLHSFIAESGLSKPVVCGHSMGSAVALDLAVRHPEAVGGLILVGAGAKLGVDLSIVEGLRAEPMKTIEQTITPMSYFKIDLGLGREARAALSFSNLPVFLNDYMACDGFDMRSSLSTIASRTLVICGENDRMTPPKWSSYLAQNLPNATISFVKDAGHMLPLERPEALSELVQSFLSSFSR